MNQRDAVIETMKANGGFASLAHLYRESLKIPGVEWKTKTPFKSINRIVQDARYFFRIRPGVWGLISAKDRLPSDLRTARRPETDHTFYQGLLVELGNLRNQKTFVPYQDRGKMYLGKPLGDIISVAEIYEFTYADIVRRASTVDIVWFNSQRMPTNFFEVENTTDMQSALLKFAILEAFHVRFRIVAPIVRKREFDAKVAHPAFANVRDRTAFTSYDVVSQMYSKQSELAAAEKDWN